MPEHSVFCRTFDDSSFQWQDHEWLGGGPQWTFTTGIEQPSQEVSSVDAKATLADQTPLASSLMLWVTSVLIAGLVVVALIPNLILGVVLSPGMRWQNSVGDGEGGALPEQSAPCLTFVDSSFPRRDRDPDGGHCKAISTQPLRNQRKGFGG